MGSSKPRPIQAPYAGQQQTTNTFAPYSIANTPEAQSYLSAPLDFGSPVSVDPGVGRRTDLAEQEAENRANSVFTGGAPAYFRRQALASELRGIRAQGNYEAQNANYLNQQANNALTAQRTTADLER